MKIGDKVLTRNNEIGTIVAAWEHNDNSYDWWVEIAFSFQNKNFTTKVPFKRSDLKFLENSSHT